MANRSVTTRRTAASSTQASAVGVYATTSNNYTLIGSTIDINTQFTVANIQFGAPGVTVPGTSLNSPVVTPVITTVYYTDFNYNILSTNSAPSTTTSGLRIIGQNFLSNAQVYLQGNVANSTYVNSTEIRLPLPPAAAATANTLMVFNSNVSGAVYYPGIQWQNAPVWVTAATLPAGNVGDVYSTTVSATGSGTVTYSVASYSTLPAVLSLNSSTGVISGTLVGSPTAIGTFNFDIIATNTYSQIATRTFSLTVGYLIQYLVVAGGGAGGTGADGGGGGAGGLLSGSTTFAVGTTYTISVGAGGAGGTPSSPTPSQAGFSSNISGPGFTTVTANGGGGAQSDTGGYAGSGGSGGGTLGPLSPTHGLATGSPGYGVAGTQGYPGGYTNPLSPTYFGGAGGGGGAGGTGGNGNAVTPVGAAGAGGSGVTWPYTGPATYYAGGGGGGGTQAQGPAPGFPTPAITAGSGGQGGGGPGSQTGNGTAGTTNTGGGGGGGGYTFPSPGPSYIGGNGGAGGSGVVIIAVPTPNYPGAYGPQATTPPSAPGMTIITFNSSGTYTT